MIIGRHCVFMLHPHLIFVTKYRGKVFTNAALKRLEEINHEVGDQFEVELEDFNGEQDPTHLRVGYPPKVQLSKLINSLKGVSSKRLKEEFKAIKDHWICKRSGALWSPSYLLETSTPPLRPLPEEKGFGRNLGNFYIPIR